jgi:hypothetical protein
LAAYNPKRIMLIPPITGRGIAEIRSFYGFKKASKIAITAAPPVT